MIKNERQYLATTTQLKRMEGALDSLSCLPLPGNLEDAAFQEIQFDAISGQILALQSELREYNDLRSGTTALIEASSFEELPRLLIAARIAKGFTQKDLADLVGTKEQVIQRYEANDYESTSFHRMNEIAQILGITISNQAILVRPEATTDRLFQQLENIGLSRSFIESKVLPPQIVGAINTGDAPANYSNAMVATRAALPIQRVFGFSPSEVFAASPLTPRQDALGAARLKAPKNASERQLASYAIYARYIADIILRASSHLVQLHPSEDPATLRREIIEQFGELSFESVLRFSWSLGIPVIPLRDRGTFHGALWRFNGRNAIVLKRRTDSPSRWMMNLLHELRHASQEPDQADLGIVDENETLQDWKDSEAEAQAQWFAIDITLDGRAEEFVKECVTLASGRTERLKSAVTTVSQRHSIDIGALADYMAYRLQLRGTNWWGTADNLQPHSLDPWFMTRGMLWDNLDLNQLDQFDTSLLSRALISIGDE